MIATHSADRPITTGIYIDGVVKPAEGGRTYDQFNPARPNELVGQAALASLNDVDDATLTVNLMLDFATQFSENFHASICDGNRLPLTKQMISHIKSTAQEVSRLKQVSDFA